MAHYVTKLECSKCSKLYDPDSPANLCECGSPIVVRYDLQALKNDVSKEDFGNRRTDMWRYRELLPVKNEGNIVSLGEGFTPLVHAKNLGSVLGLNNLFLKDETVNPTGSFKARGLSCAISKAKELGITRVSLPTAGNAGGAAAAYAAKAGMKSLVAMPSTTPVAFKLEVQSYGSEVVFTEGSIVDAGKKIGERKSEGWFDLSTLKEPYRLEGKKTMGIELAEQFNWELPDVIIYPTGGGTGLIGMWKAFNELEEMGWISGKKPKMVSVQMEGCAPIVKAFLEGKEKAEEWENPRTLAAGLRVPKAVGDFLMLRTIRESSGTAVAAPENEIVEGINEISRNEGIFSSPECGALYSALKNLIKSGFIQKSDKVVVFLTGSAYKYLDSISPFYSQY